MAGIASEPRMRWGFTIPMRGNEPITGNLNGRP